MAQPLIERVVVSDAFDAADDWIAGEADARTVVITGDILLADRCLKAGATVIGHNGKPFTTASIGGAAYRMLTPTGMAEADPAADNTTAEGKAQNRRVAVNILVSKAVEGLEQQGG